MFNINSIVENCSISGQRNDMIDRRCIQRLLWICHLIKLICSFKHYEHQMVSAMAYE